MTHTPAVTLSRRIFTQFVLLILTAGSALAANQYKVSQVDGGMPYLLHLPAEYDANPTKYYPTIMHLHGWGGRCKPSSYGGTSELNKVENEGIAAQIKNGHPMSFTVDEETHHFIVISPQIKEGKSWNAADIVALLDEVKQTVRIDESRVYLTGFSYGGQGTWNVLVEPENSPNRFAAAAPAHGRSLVRAQHGIIAQNRVALWIFGGTHDTTEHTPSEVLRASRDVLIHHPDVEVRTTMQEGAGHTSTHVYSTGHAYYPENVYEWFLTKTLQTPYLEPIPYNNLSRAPGVTVTAGDFVSGRPPERTNDGITNSYWASTSNDPELTWLKVDLGSFKDVSQFYIYGHTSENPGLKPSSPSGNITAFADAGGGKTRVTASGHGFQDGESVIILNNPAYSGTFAVESRATNTFVINKPFTGSGTGNWQAPNYTIKSYSIQASPNGVDSWTTLASATNNYQFHVQHFIPSTPLRYIRLVINDGDRMPLANEFRIYEFEVIETPPDPPTAPENLAASSITSGAASLSWEDTSGNESAFRLYWNTSNIMPASPNLVLPADTTSHLVTGLAPSTEYYFWVTAYNYGGESEAAFTTFQTLEPSAPTPPTQFTTTSASPTAITVVWNDAADNEEGYHVYWSTTNVRPETPGAELPANSTGHYISGLEPNTLYYFWVTAHNFVGESPAAATSKKTPQSLGSIDTGLLSHWNFDEGTGSTAFDATGFKHGTLHGNASWIESGKLNGAIQFDGTDDWVQVNGQSDYGGSALSVSLWMKPQTLDGTARGIISKRNGTSSSQRCFSIFTNEANNRIFVDLGAQRVDTGYSLSAGDTWRHLVMTFDGTLASDQAKVYLDGVLIHARTIPLSSIPTISAPLTIGILNVDYGSGFAGAIDNVRIHNRALTPAEVEVLWIETAPEEEPENGYASWAATMLSGAPESERGPLDDPESDGIPNVMEYLFALNPMVPDAENPTVPQVVEVEGKQYLELIYIRNMEAASSGIVCTPVCSSNLLEWLSQEDGDPVAYEVAALDNGDGTETVTVRSAKALEEAASLFMRLEVSGAE